ncbi:MAG: hypothetical protein MZV63_43435 [Marinilabiliales bacterium]|nr:hypothetical protein [Marinilabiliales bacterium]
MASAFLAGIINKTITARIVIPVNVDFFILFILGLGLSGKNFNFCGMVIHHYYFRLIGGYLQKISHRLYQKLVIQYGTALSSHPEQPHKES